MTVAAAVVFGLACAAQSANAQDDRGRPDDRGRDAAFTRLDRGMNIPVRLTESIEARQTDYRVYNGVVDQEVRGDNGRLAIPRGSRVELILRESEPRDMMLDLESISVNGQRYAIKADPDHVVGTSGRPDFIGSIVGSIRGTYRGPAVRIPGGTLMNFRLERPLEVGVADRGVDRNGHHYHDWYGRGRGGN